MHRRLFTLSACAALAPGLARAGLPEWPSRAVRLLAGFPAGSTPDLIARAIAGPLGRALGQTVIVDNRPGASGNIAANLVAKARDGHTLGVLINGNLTSAKLLYPNLPYDPDKDFCPLGLLATAPLALAAPASAPSGADFFAQARAAGGRWNYGSVGIGSVAHLGMELLKSRVPGMNPAHVPYNGNPAVVAALIGGQIQMALIPPGLALPQVKAGKLRVVGVTSRGRSPLAPDWPPLAELVAPGFELQAWNALIGPASLPAPAQARLADAAAAIMRQPALRENLLAQGWLAAGGSPEELTRRIRQETELLGGIIRTLGIRLE